MRCSPFRFAQRAVDLIQHDPKGRAVTALHESPPEGTATASGQGERQPIRVMLCCNPGYYQHLAVALASLLAERRGQQKAVSVGGGHARQESPQPCLHLERLLVGAQTQQDRFYPHPG